MSVRGLLLLPVHAAIGLAVIGLLWRQYQERQAAVVEMRRTAADEHAATERARHDNAVAQQLRQGLEQNDPYAVELMARERLQYARPGEIAPPPLPAIDKPTATAIPSSSARTGRFGER